MGAFQLRHCKPLTCAWIDDVETGIRYRDQEKTVTRGVDLQGETIITCFVLEDRLTLGWGFTNVEGVNHVFRAEDGEGQ
jgi:hypothetical protein